MPDSLDDLKTQLRRFSKERNWEQFHAPKNLAMALAVEAAELLEPFQWLTEVQSRSLDVETHAKVEQELADVLLYLIQLADQLHVSLIEAAQRKLELNARKYPVELAFGNAKKLDER